MTEPTWSAWKLYWSMFKDGDEVVIITDDDKLYWGELETHNDGIELIIIRGPSRHYSWDQIRFMSHDGFPVKKLMGADGGKSIEKLDTTDTQKVIRAALVPGSMISVTFGDPFVIEDCFGKLLHPGNCGPAWWNEDGEEVVTLQSRDGANGLLWGLETLYSFEAVSGR